MTEFPTSDIPELSTTFPTSLTLNVTINLTHDMIKLDKGELIYKLGTDIVKAIQSEYPTINQVIIQ